MRPKDALKGPAHESSGNFLRTQPIMAWPMRAWPMTPGKPLWAQPTKAEETHKALPIRAQEGP